ncbi:hypothetical protein T01_530 [Trichinella spiralis]|uniref:Uncharacterized protein n=1 Tax=Trichinella spiralis TaxID=6334 RepID=A0A0V1BPU6_TRISP|nr:hypothetical protein T01_530 [Trichinella spiralis]
MFTMKLFYFYLKAGPSYLVTQFIAMKARCQISIFPSSDMKQRDCGKANISCPTQLLTDCSLSFTDGKRVLRSYLVAPFSAMSTGVTWSTIIPLFYTLYEEASSKSHSVLWCGYSNQILNAKHFPFASINMEPQHKKVFISLSSSNPYRPLRLCSASTIRQSNQAVLVTLYLTPATMFVRVSINVLKTGYDKN